MIDLRSLTDSDKTEEPTQRRLSKAAAEGRQADAGSLARPVSFLAALAALAVTTPPAFAGLCSASHGWLASAASGGLPDASCIPAALASALLPVAAAGFAASAATRLAFGSQLFVGSRLSPDTARLGGPAAGQWSPINLAVNLLWTALKLSVLAAVARLTWLAAAADATPMGVLARCRGAMLSIAAAWLVLGGLEFLVERASFLASLRMTRVEADDDSKMAEGDPQVKARVLEAVERRLRKPPSRSAGAAGKAVAGSSED
ncbi:MAG: EscU/YscU/HrcU family type III secretion system export apparatus switch protein [Candidatus Wallbacteria bacterium]|nr:EscU/YscU/HrcU family type III secretion system export apparatus switch protein [Candidatus Wallbacteria bacterium]